MIEIILMLGAALVLAIALFEIHDLRADREHFQRLSDVYAKEAKRLADARHANLEKVEAWLKELKQ